MSDWMKKIDREDGEMDRQMKRYRDYYMPSNWA